MFNKHTVVALTALSTALSAVLAAGGSLQAQTIAGEARYDYNKSFGTGLVTGSINAFARSGGGDLIGYKTPAGAPARAVSVEAGASCQAKIFGTSRSLGHLHAKAGYEEDFVRQSAMSSINNWTYQLLLSVHGATYANNWLRSNSNTQTTVHRGYRGASLKVELLGKTLINQHGPSINRSFGLPTLNAFGRHGVGQTFWIAFIPVTVAANMGVKSRVGLTLAGTGTDVTNAHAKVNGTGTITPNGWVSAGLGFQFGPFGASAGIQGDIDLGTTTLRPTLSQSLAGRVSYLDVNIVPVTVRLSLYARLSIIFRINKTWTLASWSSPAFSFRKVL